MPITRESKLTILDWIIMASSIIAAIVIAEVAGFSPKWENASVYTIIIFVGVVVVLRASGRQKFSGWKLAGIFVLHTTMLSIIMQTLPENSQGLRGIPMIIAGMVEGLLILSIMWRNFHQSDQ